MKFLKRLKLRSSRTSTFEDFASRLQSEPKTQPEFDLISFLKTEPPTEEERRRDFRKPGKNSIVLRFATPEESAADESVVSTTTEDMSPGGAKITAGQTVPTDAVLKVELELPELQKTVSMKGKVKWVNSREDEKQFEIGLEFVNPPSEDLLSLLEYTYKE